MDIETRASLVVAADRWGRWAKANPDADYIVQPGDEGFGEQYVTALERFMDGGDLADW